MQQVQEKKLQEKVEHEAGLAPQRSRALLRRLLSLMCCRGKRGAKPSHSCHAVSSSARLPLFVCVAVASFLRLSRECERTPVHMHAHAPTPSFICLLRESAPVMHGHTHRSIKRAGADALQ